MSKLKKVLLMCTTYVLVAALAIGGTLAYLQAEDSDVNVMTLGNVKIEQNEHERVVENGEYKVENGSYVLKDFTQDKLLLPSAISTNTPDWDWDTTLADLSKTGFQGTAKMFKPGSNAQDKIVTVKNTGLSDAYVRTWIALEDPFAENRIGVNVGNESYYTQTPWFTLEIKGVKYSVTCFTYKQALKPGEVSSPSLIQVYLNSKATNEDMELLGGTYEILALSQAVQAAGFADAATALDTAFGDDNAENAAKWFGGVIAKHSVEEWDGTADTSWYNENDTEFIMSSAEQLAGLAELVDEGNTFAGKTIKLAANLDLYLEGADGDPVSFEPIGSFSEGKAFEGTFDGQDFTISNMYQNGWALANGYWDGPEYGMGLFSLVENATVKNLNIDGASLPTEANIIGVVAGGAANCVFENINITGAYLGNHSWYSGGAIGWAEGEVKLINCDIDATSAVSSQWGDFNNANGGLIGGIDPAATIILKDCDVACVIDAYNDVTSAYEWYSYRNCGMLIGDTGQKSDPDGDNVGDAIAPNLTCENVTVTYGDWANYHYCQFNSSGYPFCRVEAGESTGAYGNARVGEYTDANGNKVVDDSHVHNDGEKHNELIVFDQLYGGATGDRYCTYGAATHPGVTVIYNNK